MTTPSRTTAKQPDQDLTEDELEALLAQAPAHEPLPAHELDRWAAEDQADAE